MLSRFAARLTYANVVSTLALFMVLGGGAYAASALPNNSVGPEQIVKDGVLKPEIGEAAVGTTEIKTDGVRSGDVKNFSLRCEDFRPAEEACGVPGPQGPVGPPGPAGTGGRTGGGLTTTTVRSHDETIEMTCRTDGMGGSYCDGTETVTASCLPEEVATGGSVAAPPRSNQPGGSTGTIVTRDRPDPVSGVPTGWAGEASSNGYTISSSNPPPDQAVTVYVVCAS